MGEPKYIQKLRRVSKGSGHQWRTTDSYVRHVKAYAKFCESLPNAESLSSDKKLQMYLSHRAPDITASTQEVILNALVFFYRHVMGVQEIDIGPFAKAQGKKSLPEWLNKQQLRDTFAEMDGLAKLQAQLCFGSGLRLMECMRLRIKDIDFDSRIITVRDGKGGKDRATCLAPSQIESLRAQVHKARRVYDRDRSAGRPGVMLPDGVARKYPNYGSEWAWFWLWPSKSESKDPVSGIMRRHHVHETSLQKSFKAAAKRAGVAKRVTVHSLRHSFATHFLMAGGNIYSLSKLLGHADIATTAIYLHCIPNLAGNVVSPFEHLSNVVPFESPASTVTPLPSVSL